MPTHKKTTNRRRGAAAVEFAIIAPVFFTVVLGIIELGRAMMVQNALINASREGARHAVLAGATSAQVIATTQSTAQAYGITGITTSMSPSNPATVSASSPISVTVSIPFSSVSWLPVAKWLFGRTLTASTTMRKEGF